MTEHKFKEVFLETFKYNEGLKIRDLWPVEIRPRQIIPLLTGEGGKKMFDEAIEAEVF